MSNNNVENLFSMFLNLSIEHQDLFKEKIDQWVNDHESTENYSDDVLDYLCSDVSDRYKTFVRNVCKAGLEDDLRLSYRGRFGYHGPALDCPSSALQDVLRHAKVKCQWDSMGLGLIVYPSC